MKKFNNDMQTKLNPALDCAYAPYRGSRGYAILLWSVFGPADRYYDGYREYYSELK
jgi:hypothetical protein